MFYNLVMFKGTKKVDHILESSTDFQSFLRHLSFINYRLLKNDIQVVSKFPCLLGHPVFSDTHRILALFLFYITQTFSR